MKLLLYPLLLLVLFLDAHAQQIIEKNDQYGFKIGEQELMNPKYDYIMPQILTANEGEFIACFNRNDTTENHTPYHYEPIPQPDFSWVLTVQKGWEMDLYSIQPIVGNELRYQLKPLLLNEKNYQRIEMGMMNVVLAYPTNGQVDVWTFNTLHSSKNERVMERKTKRAMPSYERGDMFWVQTFDELYFLGNQTDIVFKKKNKYYQSDRAYLYDDKRITIEELPQKPTYELWSKDTLGTNNPFITHDSLPTILTIFPEKWHVANLFFPDDTKLHLRDDTLWIDPLGVHHGDVFESGWEHGLVGVDIRTGHTIPEDLENYIYGDYAYPTNLTRYLYNMDRTYQYNIDVNNDGIQDTIYQYFQEGGGYGGYKILDGKNGDSLRWGQSKIFYYTIYQDYGRVDDYQKALNRSIMQHDYLVDVDDDGVMEVLTKQGYKIEVTTLEGQYLYEIKPNYPFPERYKFSLMTTIDSTILIRVDAIDQTNYITYPTLTPKDTLPTRYFRLDGKMYEPKAQEIVNFSSNTNVQQSWLVQDDEEVVLINLLYDGRLSIRTNDTAPINYVLEAPAKKIWMYDIDKDGYQELLIYFFDTKKAWLTVHKTTYTTCLTNRQGGINDVNHKLEYIELGGEY